MTCSEKLKNTETIPSNPSFADKKSGIFSECFAAFQEFYLKVRVLDFLEQRNMMPETHPLLRKLARHPHQELPANAKMKN